MAMATLARVAHFFWLSRGRDFCVIKTLPVFLCVAEPKFDCFVHFVQNAKSKISAESWPNRVVAMETTKAKESHASSPAVTTTTTTTTAARTTRTPASTACNGDSCSSVKSASTAVAATTNNEFELSTTSVDDVTSNNSTTAESSQPLFLSPGHTSSLLATAQNGLSFDS